MSVRQGAAVALVLLCAVTGCADADADDPGPEAKSSKGPAAGPTAPVPPPGKEAKVISVPLDRYDPSPRELEIISAAEDVLTARCMAKQGLDWKLAPRATAADAEPRNRRRYGVVEPEIAKVYGYHLPADRPTVAKRAAVRKAREKELGPAERKAALGSGKQLGGCVRKAKDELLKDAPDANFNLLNGTIGSTYEESMKDESVARVFGAWSACMKKDGYRYAGPMDAIQDERWLKDDHVSRAEIRQAGADVRCKKRTDLVAVWNAAENRIQRKAIEAESGEFTKLAQAQRAWMDAAHRVLGRGEKSTTANKGDGRDT